MFFYFITYHWYLFSILTTSGCHRPQAEELPLIPATGPLGAMLPSVGRQILADIKRILAKIVEILAKIQVSLTAFHR